MITDGAEYAGSVFAADMDGDGDLDVLSASCMATTRSPGTKTSMVAECLDRAV